MKVYEIEICQNNEYCVSHRTVIYFSFLYCIINHKRTLTKYDNHQEHTYCSLGSYKNITLEQKLMGKITKLKIVKEKKKVKNNNDKMIMIITKKMLNLFHFDNNVLPITL